MVGSLFQHHRIHAVGWSPTSRYQEVTLSLTEFRHFLFCIAASFAPFHPLPASAQLLAQTGLPRTGTPQTRRATPLSSHFHSVNASCFGRSGRTMPPSSLRDTTSRLWSLRPSALSISKSPMVPSASLFSSPLGFLTNVLPSIPIEHRPAIEACLVRGALYPPPKSRDGSQQAVVQFTPPGLEGIYNPSFDVTPAELISAIVTEKGVAVKQDGQTTFDLRTSGVV